MYHRLLVLFSLGIANAAQIASPDVGFLHTSDGEIRPVAGLPSSFVVGHPVQKAIVSASFSYSGGIILKANEVAVVDAHGSTIATYRSGDEEGSVGISGDVATAIAWLPGTRTFVWFDGAAFQIQQLAIALPNRVLSLRRNGDEVLLLLDEGQAVSEARVSLASGDLLSTVVVPDVTAPAAYLGSALISAANLNLPCTPTAIQPMSAAWIHASCKNGSDWAVYLGHGQLQASELPHPAPEGRVRQIGPHREKAR